MSDEGAGIEGVAIGNPAAFLTGFAEQGYSGRAALNAFREAGGSMGNERFRALYGQVQDTIARRPEVMALDYDALPEGAQLGEVSMGSGDQYLTKVQLSMVDIDTGEVLTQFYSYVADELHTPGEAVEAAMDVFDTTEGTRRYRMRAIGGLVTSMSRTTPWSQ